MPSQDGIVGDVARCVYDEDWAVYGENGGNHISAACFEVIETTRNSTVDFIGNCVNDARAGAIIGFSEGSDQAVIALATIAGYKLGIPSFKVMMGEEEPRVPIRDDAPPCSLLLSCVSSGDQLAEILENVGGNVRQVIALVDEDSQAESICRQRGIDFRRLATLAEIMQRLRLGRGAEDVRVAMIEDQLGV